jgi:ABC-2 type transport system permease protein
MSVLRRIRAIASKEVRQLGRDRLTLGMIVGIPLLQIVLFGYAINLDVRHLRAAVADEAQTSYSRRLAMDLQASQVLRYTAPARSAADLERMLRSGEIVVGVYIPHDFERRLQDPRRPAVQLMVDGSDPSILSVASQLLDAPLPARMGEATPAASRFALRTYYNPERRSAVQIVPALIGVILTMTMTLFTAVAIVRERERGNLELLITTPVGTLELMLGKLLPYVVIGLVQVTIVLLVGSLLFGVPFRGDLAHLYAAAFVFIAASLALGLVISTVATTQFQAMQMAFFFFLPSILLSGFMFPFDGMPRPAQVIAEVLPLTHFVRIVRGIVLRGASLGELLRDVWPLLLFFAVTLTFAVKRFHKRLD